MSYILLTTSMRDGDGTHDRSCLNKHVGTVVCITRSVLRLRGPHATEYLQPGESFCLLLLTNSERNRVYRNIHSATFFLQGESLAQLKRGGKERFKATRKRIGKNLLHELADAWGYMIFQEVCVVRFKLWPLERS